MLPTSTFSLQYLSKSDNDGTVKNISPAPGVKQLNGACLTLGFLIKEKSLCYKELIFIESFLCAMRSSTLYCFILETTLSNGFYFSYFPLWKLRIWVIKILSVVSQLEMLDQDTKTSLQTFLAMKPSSCHYITLNCRHQPLTQCHLIPIWESQDFFSSDTNSLGW